MDGNYFTAALAAVSAFVSWLWYELIQNNKKHEKHQDHICELQRKSAISEEQIKHVITKLDDVLDLGNDLKVSNQVILKALARKSKG